MKFIRRWLIEGVLTTRTPMRVGDGYSVEARDRDPNEEKRFLKDEAQISTVPLDCDGRAYLPASGIKGNLRSWATKCGLDENLIDVIFGSDDVQKPNAVAGKAQFWNAYATVEETVGGTSNLAGWNETRLTALTASVAVDRQLRTASDGKLFHQEYVPPGISFNFKVSGNDYEFDREDEEKAMRTFSADGMKTYKVFREAHDSLLGNDGLIEILALLEGFNTDGATLGAEADNLATGWGKAEWKLTNIKTAEAAEIKQWFESGLQIGCNIATKPLPNQAELKKKAIEKAERNDSAENIIALDVALECLDNFLVNDLSRTKSENDRRKEKRGETLADKKPDHATLKNENGLPLLPRGSIKGAVRSQAERILRTLAGNVDNETMRKIACYPDDMKRACYPIHKLDKAKSLCLTCRVFGASGWSSPFKCSPFAAEEMPVEMSQEFVAIDRFTSGGAEGAKFDAKSFYQPILKGKFSLDIKRLESIGAADWAIGLLALTLRDLADGDIRIGLGRAKGYGAVRAKISPLDAAQENVCGLLAEIEAIVTGNSNQEEK